MAVVFDLDGTLIDSVYHHVLAWQRAFSDVLGDEHTPDASRLHGLIGLGAAGLVHHIERSLGLGPLGAERVASIQRAHAEAFARMPRVSATRGAVALLASLRARNVAVAIATSGVATGVARVLSDSGLAEVTAGIDLVTGSDIAHPKPAPESFQRAAQALGEPASACMVVGDSRWDMIAARRAGMVGIGVRCGGQAPETLHSAGAVLVLDDPMAILERCDELGLT